MSSYNLYIPYSPSPNVGRLNTIFLYLCSRKYLLNKAFTNHIWSKRILKIEFFNYLSCFSSSPPSVSLTWCLHLLSAFLQNEIDLSKINYIQTNKNNFTCMPKWGKMYWRTVSIYTRINFKYQIHFKSAIIWLVNLTRKMSKFSDIDGYYTILL